MEKLELRLYGLVPYQLTGIQQGIQFGHAAIEYSIENFNSEIYQDWAKNWKTFIILNGGFSNQSSGGTMETHKNLLKENGIIFSSFYEPDLNDLLSAIVFLVDERVFDRQKYPDFDNKSFYGDHKMKYDEIYKDPMNPIFPSLCSLSGSMVRSEWDKWLESIGGKKNLFLRLFLKKFKLA